MEALFKKYRKRPSHKGGVGVWVWQAVWLVAFFVAGQLFAQPLPADYFTYKSKTSGKTYLEIYLKIDNSRLNFVKNQGVYETELAFTVHLFNAQDEKVAEQSFTKKFICTKFSETINPRLDQVFLFPFRIAPGNYTAVIQIKDRNAPRQMLKKLHLVVPDYRDGRFHLSSLLIASETNGRVDGKGIPYIGGALAPGHHRVSLYFEAYNLPAGSDGTTRQVATRISFINEKGKTVKSFNQKVRTNQRDAAFNLHLSLSDLPPGEYHLAVEQTDADRANYARSEKTVAVLQSPIDLRFKKYEDVLDELRFIASKEQIERLKRVPIDQRQQAISDFWKSKDPTPLTAKNEIFEEYYGRIENANRLFSNGPLPGWKSDFGLVYILFGPPDQIVVEKSEFSFMEQQIWQYRSLRLSFTFLNRSRFDDYMLLDKGYIMANYLP
ncbi:MAG TPA: GWxTD domain-containing protein [Caldithrix abyssi]|uniref:GWxTD domain-containing protein n=1 Tax=Caldithrix abyssi TaxID=187145 RepID=A0A7V5PR42_CALAY|nr:GWxTD domain-containing protein [Caldithrix abyssi]